MPHTAILVNYAAYGGAVKPTCWLQRLRQPLPDPQKDLNYSADTKSSISTSFLDQQRVQHSALRDALERVLIGDITGHQGSRNRSDIQTLFL